MRKSTTLFAALLLTLPALSRADTISYTGSIVHYTVPTTGTYDITAVGAGGAASSFTALGGLGAAVEDSFFLSAGQSLTILVGGAGHTGYSGGGGGGATFILLSSNPLLIAGGGGGGSYHSNGASGANLSSTGGNGGAGGYEGGEGYGGGGGGGLLNNGADGSGFVSGLGGQSLSSGALGGAGSGGANGGFGGGGGGGGGIVGGGGGGGGYSGGNGGPGNGSPGAGGTSFDSSLNPIFSHASSIADGSVTINFLSAPPVPTPSSAPAGALLLTTLYLTHRLRRTKSHS